MATNREFFTALALYSTELMDRLPISDRIEPIAETFARLKPAIDETRAGATAAMGGLGMVRPEAADGAEPAGMNTIGILADRLTILICKEWYLRHRQGRVDGANAVRDEQIPDIVSALANARPGHAKLLEKVSSNNVAVEVSTFAEAYYGLLAANILMWETQEMLYVHDMESVPAEELRAYIRFFSQANMQRNAYIELCERTYWRHLA